MTFDLFLSILARSGVTIPLFHDVKPITYSVKVGTGFLKVPVNCCSPVHCDTGMSFLFDIGLSQKSTLAGGISGCPW